MSDLIRRNIYLTWLCFVMVWAGAAAAELPEQLDKPELRGRVVTGYQGWFRAPGDGTDMGWVHWGSRKRFDRRISSIEFWPDMSEATPSERYPTAYRHADGSVAHVFSSAHPRTVQRHYEWMRNYGIGGAFQQRFVSALRNPRCKASLDQVLANTRNASRSAGVPWALMYDLSGLKPGEIESLLYKDLVELIVEQQILEDPYYLHHNGEPIVAVWGVGFADREKPREYTLQECFDLVAYLRSGSRVRRCAVMLGVPYGWRENRRDASGDPRLHELLSKAQIISPWSVGRYKTPKQAQHNAATYIEPDMRWCEQNDAAYLPVVFPGFSWVNLKRSNGVEKLPAYDAIPRLGGAFLWSQAVAAKQAGAEMLYVAMFDEVDEGTAIFKVTNDPPVNGANGERFLTYRRDLPTDHYLWLTGTIGRLIAGQIEPTQRMPAR
ncbi:MAG: glycoside hydrolase family 71/99-like protein [Phycisphaeraceae bacterium]